MTMTLHPGGHSYARVSITRGRGDWKCFYNVNDNRRVIGELWQPSNTKLRNFNVKLQVGGVFRVDLGTGGVKIAFKH